MTLIALEKRKQEANAETVAILRTLLDQAESGTLRSVACCYTRNDGKVTTVIQVENDLFSMSHAIGALWWRYQAKMHEDAHSPDGETL